MEGGDLQQSIDRLTKKVDQLIARWSPWRHLVNGMMSGIGAAVGATIVIAIIVWLLHGLAQVDILKPAVDTVLPYIEQSQKVPSVTVSSPSPSPSPSPATEVSPSSELDLEA